MRRSGFAEGAAEVPLRSTPRIGFLGALRVVTLTLVVVPREEPPGTGSRRLKNLSRGLGSGTGRTWFPPSPPLCDLWLLAERLGAAISSSTEHSWSFLPGVGAEEVKWGNPCQS